MAKKKRKPNIQRRKKDPQKADTPPQSPMIDRRSMKQTMANITRQLSAQGIDNIEDANAFMQQLAGSPVPPPEDWEPTSLEKAQELMYQAWETPKRAKRLRLARQALAISPDCADAYVLLAEESVKTLPEATALYRQGVEAGKRAIGDEFAANEGHFWGVLETRPYMRARLGFAICLWRLGQQDEAVSHLWEMLRLNPNDNQGVRDVLINYLLIRKDYQGAEDLLNRYPDGMATWLYSRALLTFWQEGAGDKADDQLSDAIAHNGYVPVYLVGKKRLPRQLPAYIGFGDENEAISYAADAKELWQRDKAALDWLKSEAKALGVTGF